MAIHLMLWLLFVAAVHKCGYTECCVEEERLALLKIKAYMESSFSRYGKISWSDSRESDCCGWTMVQCNAFTGHVTQLHLSRMADNPNVEMNPPWLFNTTLFRPFRHLKGLDLSYNCISGLKQHGGSANLGQLQRLDLSQNRFAGSLHELFTNITYPEKLQVLHVNDNSFQGKIQGICKLKNLVDLQLRNNLFHGVFPSCFQNLSSLQVIDLSFNHFNGKLPEVLSSLKYLVHLDLCDNYFEGNLSLTSLANLSKLHFLRLSGNSFRIQFGSNSSYPPKFRLQTLGLRGCSLNKTFGAFPEFLSHQITNLSYLDLSDNYLFEPFPTWLFDRTKLKRLFLANNFLTGTIQFPRLNYMSLHYLDISNNNLHDELPEDIGVVFPNLIYLNFSGNHLEGLIPNSIDHIRILDLSYNNFSGELPKPLLSNNSHLEILDLSNNDLEGDIIPNYMNLPILKWLDLSNNRFSGTINDALGKSTPLFYMNLSNNNVTGQLPWWIMNFSELHSLSLSQNNMHGQIPTDIGIFVAYLDLSQNNFSGSIPRFKVCPLYFLHLHGNSLIGPIPKALSSCSSLETLDLRDNQLSGGIPLWIDKIPSLRVLLLAGNNLQGSIPSQLCQLSNISILDLSRNQLSGGIPMCFGNMSIGMRITIIFEYYLYDTTEAVEILNKNQRRTYVGHNLALMSGLDLSCNNLTGNIPPQLGDLDHIQSLNLSHNILSGPIPSQFSNLKQVESLDLSFNHLSGQLPSELVELNFLEIFNVSFNNLSGRVPLTGQFANFDERNYYGNPELVGYHVNDIPNPNKALPPASDTGEDEDHGGIDMVNFMWSFSMSCAVMFIATVAILYINPQWREAWFEFVDWHVVRRLPLVSSYL